MSELIYPSSDNESPEISRVNNQKKSEPKTGNVRSLNDCLAVERTVMANERTLLAYFRTSLAVLVVAVTIIKYFPSQGMIILGYVLLVVGTVCFTAGLMRFTETHGRLKELRSCADATMPKPEED